MKISRPSKLRKAREYQQDVKETATTLSLNMNLNLIFTLVLYIITLSVSFGCIGSNELSKEELHEYWSLSVDPSADGPYYRPALGERSLPGKWVIYQDDSIIRSTVSLVRAADALKEDDVEVIQFSIANVFTRTLQDILGESRQMIESLAVLRDSSSSQSQDEWAMTMASALMQVDRISTKSDRQKTQGEPVGLAAEPLLEMMAAYLDDLSGGDLLGDIDPGESDRLRSILTQLTMKLGFALAGREVGESMNEAVIGQLSDGSEMAPDQLAGALEKLLAEQISRAPVDSGRGDFARMLNLSLTWAPKVIEIINQFLDQWDKVQSIQLELLDTASGKTVAVTISVKPGEEIRLADVMILQPAMVFTGTIRIITLPGQSMTGELAILFKPSGDDSGVQLRFEGVLWSVAKLLAFPLADANLREVRVLSRTKKTGRQVIRVSFLCF